jgi:hypothetical protein
MSVHEANAALLKIFGLEGLRVAELTVRAAANELPTITIRRHLIDWPKDPDSIVQVFTLGMIEPGDPPPRPEPVDPYERALFRVQAVIESAAAKASAKIRADHERAMLRIQDAQEEEDDDREWRANFLRRKIRA